MSKKNVSRLHLKCITVIPKAKRLSVLVNMELEWVNVAQTRRIFHDGTRFVKTEVLRIVNVSSGYHIHVDSMVDTDVLQEDTCSLPTSAHGVTTRKINIDNKLLDLCR
jgi:hypothetical protein